MTKPQQQEKFDFVKKRYPPTHKQQREAAHTQKSSSRNDGLNVVLCEKKRVSRIIFTRLCVHARVCVYIERETLPPEVGSHTHCSGELEGELEATTSSFSGSLLFRTNQSLL